MGNNALRFVVFLIKGICCVTLWLLRYTFECFIYMLYYTIYIIRFMAVQRLATSNNYNN